MNTHTSETCSRLGCHDGRFLSRHHFCECYVDEAPKSVLTDAEREALADACEDIPPGVHAMRVADALTTAVEGIVAARVEMAGALPEFATERLFDQRDAAIDQRRRYRRAWMSARRRANRGWLNYHAAIGILDATDRGEVGTGAGGDGDPAQTEATLRVNRSVDCPEAPAQAHPLAATDLPEVACFDHREVGVVRDCMRCDTARLDPPRKKSDSSHDIALEVLARLSEQSTDGRLRDAIALVRSALWDEVES